MTRAALLLAGGAGTRLRPLSSDENPKQFLRLWSGKSLLQMTYERVRDLDVFVSTNDMYSEKVHEHVPAAHVIAEPARRNTAPALALCCFEIGARLGEETVVAALPADHFIADEAEFRRVLDRAFAYAESHDVLVTIGITPTEPNTGYGYLELGEPLADGVVALRRFVEKPDRARAEEFVRAGNYAWNGGIFVWRVSVFRAALQQHAPEIAKVTRERYEEAPSISIDYALMEKAQNVVCVPGEFGWSDVGSWDALIRAGAEIPAGVRPE
ncbi:MAG TPA: mannose-1-phosphate guanylyltransferase [Thermoanaerobaculia bacterium]